MDEIKMELKRPLQALLIAPDKEMRKEILEDIKKITIREGWRDYKPGFAVLCCHLDPFCVGVDITDVRYCLLKDVKEEEHRDDGFQSLDDLLYGLRNYYKDINYESKVTVIRWNNVRGGLVHK